MKPCVKTGSVKSGSFKLGSFAGPSTAQKILSRGQLVGRDIALTNTKAGTTGSITQADVEYGPNTVGYDSGFVQCMNGATNLVDTDLMNWVNTLGAVSVSSPSTGVYRISVNNPGTTSTLDYNFASASLSRTGSLQVRKISGVGVVADFFGFTEGDNVKGDSVKLNEISESWQTLSSEVTSADLTNRLRFRFSSNSVITIEVRVVRAVNSTVKHARFADGSPALESYASDVLTCSPAWAAEGTVVQTAIPYGWDAGEHPVSEFARLFSNASVEMWVSGNITVVGSGGSPTISTGGTLLCCEPQVVAADWNGTSIGGRTNGNARVEAAELDVPTGIMYIGNRADTLRPFHGLLQTYLFDHVLTDTEWSIIWPYLKQRAIEANY